MNSPYAFIADLPQQIPEIPADSIVSRTIHSDDDVKVILFGFAAGQELSEHTAAMPAMLYVVQGEANLTLGGDSLVAKAGAWVHMPPRLPHSIVAKTPVVMLLLMFKSTAMPKST